MQSKISQRRAHLLTHRGNVRLEIQASPLPSVQSDTQHDVGWSIWLDRSRAFSQAAGMDRFPYSPPPCCRVGRAGKRKTLMWSELKFWVQVKVMYSMLNVDDMSCLISTWPCELCCSLFAFFDEGLEPRMLHRNIYEFCLPVCFGQHATHRLGILYNTWDHVHHICIKIFLISNNLFVQVQVFRSPHVKSWVCQVVCPRRCYPRCVQSLLVLTTWS